MRKELLIGIVLLLLFNITTGCAGVQDAQQNAGPGSSLNDNVSNAYEKLVSFKTDGYEQLSVKEFNKMLLPEFGELLNANSIVTTANLSAEDENYDFITVTMNASLNELYAETMDDEKIYFGYVRKERLSEPLDETEKIIFETEGPSYDFLFIAGYTLKYEIPSPDTLTIAERDNVLRSFGEELQTYVDSLSEEELTDRSIYKNLPNQAETILKEFTPDGMEIFYKIDIEFWNNDACIMPGNPFGDDEYEKLLALQFDGYESMSVSEFQSRVWDLTDTVEYWDLLDCFSKSMTFYEQKDCDEMASFYFYVLELLTAEKWQSKTFSGFATTDFPMPYDQAVLEYVITLNITDADMLTVRDYNNTRLEIYNILQNLINCKTAEELQNESEMEKAIDNEVERIRQQYNTNAIKVNIDYSYMPLANYEKIHGDSNYVSDEKETRKIGYGTKEDYDSLLALMISDYANMSVADFNLKLLDWADEDCARMERINADYAWNDYRVNLRDDELSFVRFTVYLSGLENGKYVQSQYTGQPEVDPVYDEYLPQKLVYDGKRHTAWCNLYYQFSYHLTDKEILTVGERDQCVESIIGAIQDFWDETSIDELLIMTENDVVRELQNIASKYSNDQIVITMSENQIHFENADERNCNN